MQVRKLPVLATGYIKLQSNAGKTILARALFDSGAELNIITESLVKALTLKRDKCAVMFHGVTGDE